MVFLRIRDQVIGVHHRVDDRHLFCLVILRRWHGVDSGIDRVEDERHDDTGIVAQRGIRRPIVDVTQRNPLTTLLGELDFIDGDRGLGTAILHVRDNTVGLSFGHTDLNIFFKQIGARGNDRKIDAGGRIGLLGNILTSRKGEF